jgi:Plastocyanin
MNIRIYLLTTFLIALPAFADEVEVGQKDKKFSISEISIKVGDSVKFTNNDPFFHNVFSLSDAALFDLGSYPKGESKTVTFDTAGDVDVECAIHPDMRMVVHVK